MDKPSVCTHVEPLLLLKFTTGLQSSVHVIKELLWWITRILRRLNVVSATQFFCHVSNDGSNMLVRIFIGVKNVPTNARDKKNNEKSRAFLHEEIWMLTPYLLHCGYSVQSTHVAVVCKKRHRAKRHRVSKESVASVFRLEANIFIRIYHFRQYVTYVLSDPWRWTAGREKCT
jgi:hypothetical protein